MLGIRMSSAYPLMATHTSPKRAVEIPTIPDRLYFKIGDVARILKVEPYVLRFWESQFPQLKPNKSGTGQRLYRKRDVEVAVEIKRLVYGEGYTLSGARQALGQARRADSLLAAQAVASARAPEEKAAKNRDKVVEAVGRAKAELREIAAMLTAPASAAQVHTIRRKARPAPTASVSGSLFDS
jgi:DNA-binding transcriptional MerR regulator